jgi:hypothetical protein
MIKKLRNQPYAPKVGASSQMGARGRRKKWVLMKVYNTHTYWVFGRCLSFGIIKTREHSVSESGSVSFLR